MKTTDGTTHWEGCERWHHGCALEMLASSQIALRFAMEDRTALRAEVARLRKALGWCSAASDFAPGGCARVGWEKLCAPLLLGTEAQP